jgi:subtilisin family serine protease
MRAGLLLLLAAPAVALAQLNLPRLPALPSIDLNRVTRLPDTAQQTVSDTIQDLRRRTISTLLREHAATVEADPAGEPIRRQELLVVAPPPGALDAALALGFRVLREQTIEPLGLRHVVLQPPPGTTTAGALAALRRLDERLDADFNHLYTPSGALGAEAAGSGPGGAVPGRRVGLVDSGVDRRHPALRGAALQAWGCGGAERPAPHGTAVASLLVGRDQRFSGAAPEAALYAADVYCGDDSAGAAETLAQALGWLAREQVAVINVSLVGPPNRLLERTVQALLARGHLVVAAVGNDGPAAPPLYPAAFAGVVGVTGVQPSRRVLPEAAQGTQVSFAAPGAELAAAAAGAGYRSVRGTSFAAPLVAGLLADALRAPDPAAATRALQRLADGALDLGAPGRDPVFGFGLVAEQARIAPERVQAAR